MSEVRRYRSRPQEVEAIQWRCLLAQVADIKAFAPGKVRVHGNDLELLAGKDGAQDWVPVPVGHWLVHAPGDDSDVWPVDPDYFAAKYEPAAGR